MDYMSMESKYNMMLNDIWCIAALEWSGSFATVVKKCNVHGNTLSKAVDCPWNLCVI